MKILMISSGFPPKVNTGAEKFCYELTKKLLKNGITVGVATDTNFEEFNEVRLYKLFKVKNKYLRKLFFDYYNIKNIFRLNKILKEFKPDIIHFHNIYGISTQLISHTSEKYPVIVTVHDYWPFCFNSTMLKGGKICKIDCITCRFPLAYLTRNIKRKHLKNAILVAPIEFMKNKLISAGFENIKVIHNGIDMPEEKAKLNKRIIYIGRISPEKGINLFLESIRELKVDVEVFGDGPLLPALRKKYSGDKNIQFRGFVENIKDEYRKGGILIFPSIWPENLPYVVLEAMSYGLPIIGSNLGVMADILDNGETGLLYNPFETNELKEKIMILLEDKRLIEKLTRNGIEKVKREFNWERTVKDYVNLYKSWS